MYQTLLPSHRLVARDVTEKYERFPMALRINLHLLALGAVLLLAGCAGDKAKFTVRKEIAIADRQKDWALVYYQSWRSAKDGFYLRLARDRMSDAVRSYFVLQMKIGHSYPDFYIADNKRLESCRFLKEMDREAGKYKVRLENTERHGCLK